MKQNIIDGIKLFIIFAVVFFIGVFPWIYGWVRIIFKLKGE